jgi:hypothetical protein
MTSSVRVSCSFIHQISKRRQRRAKTRRTRAVLSLLLVTKYVRSGWTCKSVTTSLCACSLLTTSSPVLASHRATFPDSCPVRIRDGSWAKVTTVALDPMGLNVNTASFDSGVHVEWLFTLCRSRALTISPVPLTVNTEYTDSTLVSHALLRYTHNLRVILAERHTLYSGRELPRIQAFPRRHLP